MGGRSHNMGKWQRGQKHQWFSQRSIPPQFGQTLNTNVSPRIPSYTSKKRSELALAPPPYLRQHIASIPLKKSALIRMGRMKKEVIKAQFNILHSECNVIFRVRRDTR